MTEPVRSGVSIVGLGLMGSALAEALIGAGRSVTVWNRSRDRAEALASMGARIASSPAEAITASEVTILSVSDHAATMEILGSVDRGLEDSKRPLVQLSSITAAESRDLNQWAAANNLDYLEGSVFALPDTVLAGTGMFLLAGPLPVFEKCQPTLRIFGETLYLSPEIGAAVSFDRVYYAWVYGSWLAFIQGAAMAHAKGFGVQTYVDFVLSRLPAAADRYEFFGRLMAERTHDEVQCRLDVHAAAFAETLAMCREAGVSDALPAAVMSQLESAIADGYGDREITAVFETLIKGTARS